MTPELAIIIPHYNDPVRLERCLGALMAQDRAGVEVAVVDNESPVDLSALQARFPEAAWIFEPIRGAAAARNRGVAETRAPWIVFLDSDCVPEAGWLARARQVAQGPQVITGGEVTVFDESPPPRSGAEAFEATFAFQQAQYIAEKGFSVTANLITPRVIFDAVGPLIVGRSEDLDWCQRARAAGYDLVYDPALVVAHPSRSDWAALARKWRRLTAEAYETRRANGGRAPGWVLRALAMVPSALFHGPRMLRAPGLSTGDRLRGLGTLFRLRLARMIWMLRQALTGRAEV
ncbi:MAG: glycosyltransferase family 2 protein [Pseudomonadota bacterium]